MTRGGPQRRAKVEATQRIAQYAGIAQQFYDTEGNPGGGVQRGGRGGHRGGAGRQLAGGNRNGGGQPAAAAQQHAAQVQGQQQQFQQQLQQQQQVQIVRAVVGGGATVTREKPQNNQAQLNNNNNNGVIRGNNQVVVDGLRQGQRVAAAQAVQVAVVGQQGQQQGQQQLQQPGGAQIQNANRNFDDDDDFKFAIPPKISVPGFPAEYVLKNRLGKGGFGQVFKGTVIPESIKLFRGTFSQDAVEVAIKLEHKSSKGCMGDNPPKEWQIYEEIRSLGATYGMPGLFAKGRCEDFFVMIMELLGPSLWDYWNQHGCSISQEFAACFIVEAVVILKELHSKGYIHGDIKPENFLLGPTNSTKERKLFLVDFGLAAQWKDQYTRKHVKYNQRPDDFRGTVRYASIHAHLGRTPSRRDDLESLAYTTIFMLNGRLPWQGLCGDNKQFLVAKKKMQISAELLCSGLKPAFKQFVDVVINIKFDEEPPYTQLIAPFTQLINAQPTALNLAPQAETVMVGAKRNRSEFENPGIDMWNRKKQRTGCGAKQWITVYSFHKPKKQRYHYNVGAQRLEHHIQRGYDESLRISAVACSQDLWAIIMDAGTPFDKQIFTMQLSLFLPKEWIIDKWEKQYYISAVAGSDTGAALVVMSQGTKYQQQSYKVSESFPYEWIKRKWKEGFFITSMATARNQWAVVMSRTQEFRDQVIELDFQYPSEGIHKRWSEGYRITSCAATADQCAFALSTFRTISPWDTANEAQETLRTSQFPSTHVKEKWEKDLYITGVCFGRVLT